MVPGIELIFCMGIVLKKNLMQGKSDVRILFLVKVIKLFALFILTIL